MFHPQKNGHFKELLRFPSSL